MNFTTHGEVGAANRLRVLEYISGKFDNPSTVVSETITINDREEIDNFTVQSYEEIFSSFTYVKDLDYLPDGLQIQGRFLKIENKEIYVRYDYSLCLVKGKIKSTVSVNFFYDGSLKNLKIIENELYKLEKFRHVTEKCSQIYMLGSNSQGLLLEEFDLQTPMLNLTKNYGMEFEDKHQHLTEVLNKKGGKGIVLLHSVPGCGKTTYIKYLISQITDKKVIYITPHMIESIADPSFISFIKQYTNSVLIIEDAEKILKSRDAGNNNQSAISNILNLTDGILSDVLNIQIVATFNTSVDNIDPALLRKGRLILNHEFGKLSMVEAIKLANELGLDSTKVKGDMTLAEIYNLEDEFAEEKKVVRKIGF